jgi:hypothetical protein
VTAKVAADVADTLHSNVTSIEILRAKGAQRGGLETEEDTFCRDRRWITAGGLSSRHSGNVSRLFCGMRHVMHG